MAKIAMVVSNRYDPDPRVQKEAASLAEAGHDVCVYAYDRQHEKQETQETIEGVVVHRLRLERSSYGSVWSVVRGVGLFNADVKRRLLSDPPDVVHCHDQDTCPVGLWWKRKGRSLIKRRTYFVFDAHEFYWSYMLRRNPDSPFRKAAAGALRLRDRYYAKNADLLITVTDGIGDNPGTAQQYEEWGCRPVVVWNAPRKVEEIPALPDAFTVGFLGVIRHVEMFEWLISAIERLDPRDRPKLRIAGGGVARMQVASSLEAAAERLGIRCAITGPFDMKGHSGLMADCSVQYCLYPSSSGNIERAMPVKLFESVAYRRPVIGNSGNLMGAWIEKNGWGWTVEEGNVEQLAHALVEAKRTMENRTDLPGLAQPPLWEEQSELLRTSYEKMLRA